MNRSLHRRLTLGLIAFATVLLLALLVLEGYFIASVARFFVSTRLEHDSETLLLALQAKSDASGYQLDEQAIHPIYQRPFSGHYFTLVIDQQEFRSRSLWDETLALPADLAPLPQLLTLTGPQQQPVLAWIQAYELANARVTIVIAESLAPLQPLIRQAQLWSMAAASLLMLLFALLQYRWAISSLAPLQTLQQQLRQLQLGQRQQLTTADAFAELEPLINELNHLITALDERITRSRHATGNLAHALKTPMTALQQLCDASADRDPEFAQALARQLQLIKARIDHELKHARIAGAPGKRGRLNLRDTLVDLAHTLQQIYRDKALELHWQVPHDATVALERQDFLELAGNLLDNAFKWARHRVAISVQTEAGLRLIIEDDGPGCPGAVQALTGRGLRLDENTPGHGLGLSIVQAIVTQYQGSLQFDTGTLGGLRVTVSLP